MVNCSLEVEALSCSFGKFQAVAPTNLAIPPGEIVTLSGPNGAGKSTFLACLSGLISPTEGKVRVAGFDLYQAEREAKSRLAFVPDVPRFYAELTAWEHLQFIAMAHGVAGHFPVIAEHYLKEFNLWDARNLFPHHYSRGMRLKLGILLALIRPFEVLLLDEPTSALDYESSRLLVSILRDLRCQGKAILLSSHDPALVDEITDRKLVMQAGVISEQ